MTRRGNAIKEKIRETMEEIQEENNNIEVIQAQYDKTNLDYNKQQLHLELEQITIKHDHELAGMKPTPAKEKAKLETLPQQQEQISTEGHLTELKHDIEESKRRIKLAYKVLDFLMIEYKEELTNNTEED